MFNISCNQLKVDKVRFKHCHYKNIKTTKLGIAVNCKVLFGRAVIKWQYFS